MSALKSTSFTWKITFQKLLHEQSNNEKKAEEELILTLIKFSSSRFESNSWVLDKRSNKSHPDTIAFNNFKNMGHKGKHLVKLFAIVILNRGSGKALPTNLKNYFKFLKENKLNLYQIDKSIFTRYIYWLDQQLKDEATPLSETYKHILLNSALQFHILMNGHSFMAYTNGVEAIENPYARMTKDSKYKVIDNDVLYRLDEHFKSNESPLHIRVAYWILRLYGTRPEDTLNYPLDCVKKLTKDMATIKHAIVKNSSHKGEIEHKIEFMNLQEPMQKMLFELIVKQQKISQNLQAKTLKKNFLFTYRHGRNLSIQYFSSWILANYLKQYQQNIGIEESRRAVPRDFKKTGITMRMESGWTSPQLKEFANHRTYASIDAYTSPTETFMINEQKKVLEENKESKGRFVFKGKIVNGIGDENEANLLANPRAHKVVNLGYCPDVKNCGSHFECLDCIDLIPDASLEDYYFDQVDRYLKIAEKQYEVGDKINAKDSLHRATLFASLLNKIQIGGIIMAKRGNPNLNKNSKERRERTESLIRQAVESLEQNHEIKSIPAISTKTKELDPMRKGVSEASFRNKELEHIQSLMIELRIGKYEAITVGNSESNAELADELLKIKKELHKKNTAIKKLQEDKKKKITKIDTLNSENEELRTAIYEMEMKSKMKLYFNGVNNKV